MIPPMISSTICGTRGPGSSATINGASAATTPTSSSVFSTLERLSMFPSISAPRSGHQVHRPRGPTRPTAHQHTPAAVAEPLGGGDNKQSGQLACSERGHPKGADTTSRALPQQAGSGCQAGLATIDDGEGGLSRFEDSQNAFSRPWSPSVTRSPLLPRRSITASIDRGANTAQGCRRGGRPGAAAAFARVRLPSSSAPLITNAHAQPRTKTYSCGPIHRAGHPPRVNLTPREYPTRKATLGAMCTPAHAPATAAHDRPQTAARTAGVSGAKHRSLHSPARAANSEPETHHPQSVARAYSSSSSSG